MRLAGLLSTPDAKAQSWRVKIAHSALGRRGRWSRVDSRCGGIASDLGLKPQAEETVPSGLRMHFDRLQVFAAAISRQPRSLVQPPRLPPGRRQKKPRLVARLQVEDQKGEPSIFAAEEDQGLAVW